MQQYPTSEEELQAINAFQRALRREEITPGSLRGHMTMLRDGGIADTFKNGELISSESLLTSLQNSNMQQFPTLDLVALPMGETQIPEVGKAWKFGSEQEAQDVVRDFEPEYNERGLPDGIILPPIFIGGGMWVVIYLTLLNYYRLHPGGR